LQELILKLINKNNRVTKKQIAKEASVSEKTIERQMKKMTNVKYVGRGYSGHWEIRD
jgi:ATP-dependent DNA helicase RecG